VLFERNTELDLEKNSLQILNALDKPILEIGRDYRIVAANLAACGSFCLPTMIKSG